MWWSPPRELHYGKSIVRLAMGTLVDALNAGSGMPGPGATNIPDQIRVHG